MNTDQSQPPTGENRDEVPSTEARHSISNAETNNAESNNAESNNAESNNAESNNAESNNAESNNAAQGTSEINQTRQINETSSPEARHSISNAETNNAQSNNAAQGTSVINQTRQVNETSSPDAHNTASNPVDNTPSPQANETDHTPYVAEGSSSAARNAASDRSNNTATPQTSQPDQTQQTDETPPPLPRRPRQPASAHVLMQPPNGQPMSNPSPDQQYAYAIPVRPIPKQSQAYIATKLGLTVLSSVWGIIIISFASLLLGQYELIWVSIYGFFAVVPSIIWNTVDLITYCVRLRKEVQRGIHPGAHVGLHLVFWLIGGFGALLSIESYIGLSDNVYQCEHMKAVEPRRYPGWCDDYEPFYYDDYLLSIFRGLIAILVIWVINHFILFVLACIDTHKRNILKSAAIEVVMPMSSQAPTFQGMYLPQQQAMMQSLPQQYYPQTIMMQPPFVQPVEAQSRSPVSSQRQQVQNLAGFYAPVQRPTPAPTSASNPVTVNPPAQNAGQA